MKANACYEVRACFSYDIMFINTILVIPCQGYYVLKINRTLSPV